MESVVIKDLLTELENDHTLIDKKIDELEVLCTKNAEEVLMKVRGILNFFNEFVFNGHHQREEKVLYHWMLKQNQNADNHLIQHVINEHRRLEKMADAILRDMDLYFDKKESPTPTATLSEVSLFVSVYREHVSRESGFIFKIAEAIS